MDLAQRGAETALVECMKMQRGEQVLIVTDPRRRELAEIFKERAAALGGEALLLEMLEREHNGSEPPAAVTAAMMAADVVLAVTSKSLSHTKARHAAVAEGARVASLPGLTRAMMEGPLQADYTNVAKRSLWAAEILTKGTKAHLTSPQGTDLVFDLQGRLGQPDTGFYHQPGDFGNLPAGEAYIAPVEGKTQGRLVIDGAMSGVGVLDDPLVMEVVDGVVVKMTGSAASALEKLLSGLGQEAYSIAELGIGTNDQAQLTGFVLEDEKVMGTVHVAIGNNSFFGGKITVASHLDGIIKQPTLTVDGQVILREGLLLYE
ncbi:MAG: aminopeptidase [Limnochordia bacterium]|jgi:leucyl aminopeptidase (aminopeptidase T)